MIKYLIVKRVIKKPEGRVHEPGSIVSMKLSDECESILIDKGCIKRVNRRNVKPLAEVIENDTDNGRD